ncbi:batten's disease protein Cln3 [Hyphopichia burtonii NRRL Y-1933]|uniref:Protein BTN n=1 Tax=Hyphopichia burtonii NRRL Y-1933 TaxID=984485 RepID=A0A1E4RMZ1_9ASCO|nr:batten's disease protein Cln3 [Hyphopichia burtonii NRRL Y-1933]ODV68637.1 batten's disease protein Cln3 [Hyphopichia burtonii NRRL Y-1933]
MLIIPETRLIFISFFIFGLLNNILYVVILSAAIDLVGSSTPKAIVLLADIIPSLMIKVSAPFFIHKIAYQVRVWGLVLLSTVGMLIISFSPQASISAKILGICMASLASGMGEVSFLQLTHFYQEKYSIGGFLSGTGGAGLMGSFIYLIFTNVIGLKIWISLLIFSLLPFGFVISFYLILPTPTLTDELISYQQLNDEQDSNHFWNTLNKIKPLIKPYMFPLCTVYISEYVINQGISPTLLYPLEDLPNWLFSSYRDIYVVYGFLYQLGVFISRSSINFGLRFRQLYWLTLLQFLNVLLTLHQSIYNTPFTSIWPLLCLILYEGLLGGFSYVNTFMSVSEDVPKLKREFSMGCVGISDSFGVMMAGCINFWLESKLCSIQVENGRDWCLNG